MIWRVERRPRNFIGGVTWRCFIRATWPLGKLTIDSDGIAIAPAREGMWFLWRIFGLPSRRWDWPEVETAALARSVLGGRPRGVCFRVAGKRLDFGYIAPVEVLEEIRRYAPLKVSARTARVVL
jgi:hypothetical protein